MELLKVFEADCTHDQGHFQRLLQQGHKTFYSVDLSKATDSFPIEIQE